MDSILPSLLLRPFPTRQPIYINGVTEKVSAILLCNKCGAVDNFYSRDKKRIFRSSYCEGNQPPEQVHRNILGQEHTHLVNCAGIKDEHIHTRCGVCETVFLLELPKMEELNG